MRTLTCETLAWVRELEGGDAVVAPIAELAKACAGEEDSALLELATFLSEHLGRSGPEVIARHAIPSDVDPDGDAAKRPHLVFTDVLLERADLPRRLRIETPISVPSVVLPVAPIEGRPHRADAWLIILPLAHTLYVREGEDVHELVRREVKRLVSARELGPTEYLSLLPAEVDALEHVTVEIDKGAGGPVGRAASLRKAIAWHERRKAAVKVLESVSTAMHREWAGARDAGAPLVGREREVAMLEALLTSKERLSVVLVGEARVGKSAVFRSFFERTRDRGSLVYATSGAQLVAGMSGLGEWQERVRRVAEAAELLDAIVLFDDLSDLFAEHGTSRIDLAGALKPYVDAGRVRLAFELVPERVDFIEARSPAFFGALKRVRIDPLDAAATEAAVRARVEFDAARFPSRPRLADGAVAPLVDLAARYMPYQAFPGKALALYDELVAARESEHRHDPIDDRAVYDAVSQRTGVPGFLLRDDQPLPVSSAIAALRARVVGQAAAVRAVADTLAVVKAKLTRPEAPIATFLFVGPTGVGKTELARSLAAFLFGSDTRLVRIDMSEYTDPSAAERLFRGSGRTDGVLTRRIREQPFSVVLLDEIEKAHPSVHDLLLAIAGEGRLTDARGKTALFKDAILVLTSNLGTDEPAQPMGLAARATDPTERFLRAVDRSFRPELVARLDRIVVFDSLGPDEMRQIVELYVERLRSRRGLSDAALELTVSRGALDLLASRGFTREHGARSVRRYVEEHLAVPAAALVARAAGAATRGRLLVFEATSADPPVDPGFVVFGTESDGEISVRLDRRLRGAQSRDLAGCEAVSDTRRELTELGSLPPIEALREQAAMLRLRVHETTTATKKKKKQRRSRDDAPEAESGASISALLAEHHRLGSLVDALDKGLREVLDLEEVVLAALLDGESFGDLSREVARARLAFRRALVHALVALEPSRDAAVLLLSELDGGHAFDLYLAPLLRELERLTWTATAHLPGETAADWPTERHFGPAVSSHELLDRLMGKGGKRPRSVVLSVRGPDAGIFMGLESGVHRFLKVASNLSETVLSIELLALRPALSTEAWLSDVVSPTTPTGAALLLRGKVARSFDVSEDRLIIDGATRLSVPLGDYWQNFEEVILEQLLACERGTGRSRAEVLRELAFAPATDKDPTKD
ncbi:MAG: AAA family ATPase [Polyangiaceae bacterium]